MGKLLNLMKKKKFVVVVSLPKNDLDLATTSASCGCDAIKIHTQVVHKASNTHFGSWKEEKSIISKIIKSVKCPVGMVPGAPETLNPDEIEDAAKAGIDFIDSYDFDMPAWMLKSKRVSKMVAVGEHFQISDIKALEEMGADMIEASIINSNFYGQKLTVRNLENYHRLVKATKLPVVVPSQKNLSPHDLDQLKSIGIRGVILGVIVLGKTQESFKKNLPDYIKG